MDESLPSGVFRLSGEVHFGSGISRQLRNLFSTFGASKPAIVTDPGLRSVGLIEPYEQLLTNMNSEPIVFDGVSPNPRDVECQEAAEMFRDTGVDLIVAIGGGSPMDLAKVASGLATNPGAARDWVPPRTFTTPPIPIIAIPTTAGTGSEVTRSAVITDTSNRVKFSLRDTQFVPKIALVDPDLTHSLPRSLTASTGMDALTHAIEAYTCNRATPLTDGLALHATRLIAASLRTAVEDGGNQQARNAMMMASVIAGMAFGNADVASVHCIAESVGGRYDTPHGVANSLFLPHVFAYNAPASPERHSDIAIALGAAQPGTPPHVAAQDGYKYLHKLSTDIGIPHLTDIPGIRPKDFPWIAAASTANLSNASNAREMDESDYLGILESAWNA